MMAPSLRRGDVRVVDTTDGRVLDGDFDFFGTNLAELALEGLDGSEHITFDNDGELAFFCSANTLKMLSSVTFSPAIALARLGDALLRPLPPA